MKLLIFMSAAMLLAQLVHADNTALGQMTLPEYNVGDFTPQRVEAEFPEDAVRVGNSLYGSTFEWARDQRAAWGAGIPGLTRAEAKAGCGPIAAEALIRSLRNDPKLDMIAEIFRVAKSKGYWKGAMQGPAAEQKLLADLGVQVGDPIWSGNMEQLIRESLDKGKPVILSTNSHYFFIEGYNNRGQLFVGNSGMTKRCGAAQMSLSWISQCGGGGLALLIPR